MNICSHELTVIFPNFNLGCYSAYCQKN